MIKEKKYNVWIHLIYSVIFLSIPFLSSPDFPDVAETLGNPMGFTEVISQFYLLGFFYLLFFYLIPRFFLVKKYLKFILITVVFSLVLFSIPFFTLQHDHHHRQERHIERENHEREEHREREEHHEGRMMNGRPPHHHYISPAIAMAMSKNLYLLMLVLTVSLLISISKKWKETQKEKLNAELSYLKAQINPHFLFNTLNSVYSLAIEENAPKTTDAMVRLSDMMRYIINEADKNYVSLNRELEYIDSYIKLQSYRFGNTVKLITEIDKGDTDELIAPLILIPYIENAFKYGVNPTRESTITIKISVKDGVLVLFVENNKVNDELVSTSGIGMENTRNRLDLLYPGKHSLIIVDSDKFSVRLELQLR